MSNSWNVMNCSLPGFYVHKISQAILLEWVDISSFRDLSEKSTSPALQADSLPLNHQEAPYNGIPIAKPEDICLHGNFTHRYSFKQMKTCVYINNYRKAFIAALFIVFQNLSNENIH